MTERASWSDYFMNIAHAVSTRATCDRKHVGVVLVVDRRIVATGYNGSVQGMPHCDDVGHDLVDGHCVRTVHAEANAIAQAARVGVSLTGAQLYVNTFPCWPCFRLLVSAGISAVFYEQVYRADPRINECAEALDIHLRRIVNEETSPGATRVPEIGSDTPVDIARAREAHQRLVDVAFGNRDKETGKPICAQFKIPVHMDDDDIILTRAIDELEVLRRERATKVLPTSEADQEEVSKVMRENMPRGTSKTPLRNSERAAIVDYLRRDVAESKLTTRDEEIAALVTRQPADEIEAGHHEVSVEADHVTRPAVHRSRWLNAENERLRSELAVLDSLALSAEDDERRASKATPVEPDFKSRATIFLISYAPAGWRSHDGMRASDIGELTAMLRHAFREGESGSSKAQPLTFEQAWALKKAEGYQYGADALEQVRFGWGLATEATNVRVDLRQPGAAHQGPARGAGDISGGSVGGGPSDTGFDREHRGGSTEVDAAQRSSAGTSAQVDGQRVDGVVAPDLSVFISSRSAPICDACHDAAGVAASGKILRLESEIAVLRLEGAQNKTSETSSLTSPTSRQERTGSSTPGGGSEEPGTSSAATHLEGAQPVRQLRDYSVTAEQVAAAVRNGDDTDNARKAGEP